MKILVTGAAGFIGFHLSRHLLGQGHSVHGIDNLNDYYDPALKIARLEILKQSNQFAFDRIDIAERKALEQVWQSFKPQKVVHLAAQAGVRHSLSRPEDYISANVTGTLNVFECARLIGIEHVLFASTSSVYGLSQNLPFSPHEACTHPVSFYAVTKLTCELTAHSYAHLFSIPSTGLRFFTVYGPWGRPDMALFEFTKRILANQTIKVFNQGNHKRDFTYVDDIVSGIAKVCLGPAPTENKNWDRHVNDPASSSAPWRIYNIGNSQPVPLMDYINALESCLGKKAKLDFLPMQAGDIEATHADIQDLDRDFSGYRPQIGIEHGVREFVRWYKDYYQIG